MENLIHSPAEDLQKAAASVEFVIWERMTTISRAYLTLCNVETGTEALQALAQVMLVARDLTEQIRVILDKWNCPPELIHNVGQYTQDNLDNLWNNCWHFYNRFLHAKTPAHKTKELTRLYYLIKDVAAIAEVTPANRYTDGFKRMKSFIEEF